MTARLSLIGGAILLALVMSGCASKTEGFYLDIASSLAVVQEELDASVNQTTGMKPIVTAEGTAKLIAQITEGKPSDILLSADASSIEKLQQQGLIEGEPVPLAINKLVLATPATNPANITRLVDIQASMVKVVQCLAEVPCGKLATQVSAENRLVYTPLTETQSVTEVARLLSTGEADAGFVYATDVQASNGKLIAIEDPGLQKARTTITGVVVAGSSHPEAATKLLALWASSEFAATWNNAGFAALAH